MKKNKKTDKAVQLTSAEKDEQIRRVALFRALSSNVLASRATYGNTTTFSGLRDVYAALGYPGLDGIKYSDYYSRFRRQDVAAKIVEKPVDASWRRLPIIRGKDETSNAFKEVWEKLEKSNGIYNALIRADKISGIGQYGIILLGVNDQAENFAEPLERATELLYLQPYSEENAPIKKLVSEKNDPRYGLPEAYSLRMSTALNAQSNVETEVHHSRVIHLADNILESNVLGTPRLERVFNRLLNLELIVGGSAEMFWQGAFPGLAFSAKDNYDISPEVAAELDEEIKKYVHNLERYMKLQGIDVENLAPAVADPTAHVDVQLKMISIASGIPKRILEGSERGELSSSQDTEAWDDLMDGRRQSYCEPKIIRPLIDRLAEVGIIKLPQDGYTIEWPDLSAPSDKDLAEIGRIRSEAISKYTSTPDAQYIVPPQCFLEEIMELTPEKVERIMAEVERAIPPAIEDDGQGDDDLMDGNDI